MDISIIIVNYNVKDLILECLKSLYLYSSSSLSIEIIVVDNNSLDGSVESISEQFPDVKIIANKYNAGFSGANNQGMEIAQGNYIFLLNPDTEIISDALSQLRDYLRQHTNCSIIAPQLLNSDRSIQVSTWKNPTVLHLFVETFYLHKLINTIDYPLIKLDTTFETKTVSGAALFFSKKMIEKIGFLDEQFFWMEDIDFCYRAQKIGPLVYLNNIRIIHHSGQSQKKNYNISIANQLISKLKYYKKHGSIVSVIIANLSCFIFILSRLALFLVLFPIKEIYKLKAKAYFYTLNRFLKYLLLGDRKVT